MPEALGIVEQSQFWPNVLGVAQVPYVITSDPLGNFASAVTSFNSTFSGLIQFVARGSQTSYVNVNLDPLNQNGACESNVGMAPAAFQPQTLGGSGACNVAVLLHEMGHTIGLWHTMSRPDRDSYVTINFANIVKSLQDNFDLVVANAQTLGLYDLGSVMHYVPFAFTANGNPTIESKPPGITLSNQAGYTSGDIDAIKRLYGAAPTAVTITSNPPGLHVIVNGVTVTTPQTFVWDLNSTKTLDVPAGAQTLSDSTHTSITYTFGEWNDLGATSHTITVSPGSGTATHPTTSPAITVYSANFVEMVQYSPQTFGSGSISPSPAPQTIGGLQYYVSRQQVTLTALPGVGSQFYRFFNIPTVGFVGPSTNPFVAFEQNFILSGKLTWAGNTQAEFDSTSSVVTTLTTSPPNLFVTVDGASSFATPVSFSSTFDGAAWAAGQTHTISTSTPQEPFTTETIYNFSKWSNNATTLSTGLTVPATSSTFTGAFGTQYQVFTQPAINNCGGTVTPPQFTPETAGTQVSFLATPTSGFFFTGWSGDLSGTTNPQNVTVNSEVLATANFNTTNAPFTFTGITPASAAAGSSSATVTISGSGFTAGGGSVLQTFVFVNGAFRGATVVNANTITTTLTAADLLSTGAVEVDLQNALTTGCGIVIGMPFFVTSAATAATMERITATGTAGGAVVEWKTGFEAENLGFRVYREQAGRRVRVTPQLVAGSALMVGARTALTAGRSYAWRDDSYRGAPDTRYWIEEVDVRGQSKWHGPVAVTMGTAASGAAGRQSSALLSRLSAGRKISRPQSAPVRTMHKPALAAGGGLFDLAAKTAVKIQVREEGWYRVGFRELAAAGLDPQSDPRNWQLWAEGQQQPISVDAASNVEFYGTGLDSAASDVRVYWLAAGSQPGLRIARTEAVSGRPAASSFAYTVERQDHTTYFAALLNGDGENFFGDAVEADPVDEVLTLPHVDAASGARDATLAITLQGVTRQAHSAAVLVNGNPVGTVAFANQDQGTAKFRVSQSLLREGDNTVRLAAQGGEGDISLVDTIRLTYWRTYTADSGMLRFDAAEGQQLTVDGFSSGPIRVFDISDPRAVTEVAAQVQGSASGFSIAFTSPTGGTSPAGGVRTLMALADAQVRHPLAIAGNRPSALRNTDQAADLLILTTRDFLDAAQPLAAARRAQGLQASVVDVEDVYDEFNYGEKSPQAIQDFLSYAAANWRTAPRFVVLAGHASFDPKDYLGEGAYDLVPTRLIDTLTLETASDDWFADFAGDGNLKMAVGRLPARTAEELRLMVSRILAYEQSPAQGGVLLVSDTDGAAQFAKANQNLQAFLPGGVDVERVDAGQATPAGAKAQLLEALNAGPWIVNYAGHGSVDLWRGDLLTSADAAGLTNGNRLSFFAMMTCLNGYAIDPALDSLAEALIKAEGGGAVAVWASSGTTTPDSQNVLDQQFFRALTSSPQATVGEMIVRAKQGIADQDVRRTWILFGDPAMRLK